MWFYIFILLPKIVFMPKPKVATITLSWNQKEDLRELLSCIKKQAYKPKTVVVDNGSTDGTVEMVKKEFPEVKFYQLNENTGYASGYNVCFQMVPKDIDYVVVLDQDLIIDNDYIEKIVRRFEKEPNNTAIIAGDVQETRIKSLALPEAYIKGFHGSSFAYRNMYKKYMKYPSRFFAHTCEVDLAARLLNRGLKILFYPRVKTIHKRDSAKRDDFRIFLETRNGLWFAWRNCDFKNAIIYSMVFLPIFYSKASKSEQIPAFLKGVAAAIGGLPYCLRTREVCKQITYRDIYDLKKVGTLLRVATLGKTDFSKDLKMPVQNN